jgi:hypothetical protein
MDFEEFKDITNALKNQRYYNESLHNILGIKSYLWRKIDPKQPSKYVLKILESEFPGTFKDSFFYSSLLFDLPQGYLKESKEIYKNEVIVGCAFSEGRLKTQLVYFKDSSSSLLYLLFILQHCPFHVADQSLRGANLIKWTQYKDDIKFTIGLRGDDDSILQIVYESPVENDKEPMEEVWKRSIQNLQDISKKNTFKEFVHPVLAVSRDLDYSIYPGITMNRFSETLTKFKHRFTTKKIENEIELRLALPLPDFFLNEFRKEYYDEVTISSWFKKPKIKEDGKGNTIERILKQIEEESMQEAILASQRIEFIDGTSAYLFFNFFIKYCPLQSSNPENDKTGNVNSVIYEFNNWKIMIAKAIKPEEFSAVSFAYYSKNKDE